MEQHGRGFLSKLKILRGELGLAGLTLVKRRITQKAHDRHRSQCAPKSSLSSSEPAGLAVEPTEGGHRCWSAAQATAGVVERLAPATST